MPRGKAKTGRPTGRPSKYREEFCDLLIRHMADGGAIETFPARIFIETGQETRVCVDTVYEWVKVHPAFSEAKNLGYSLSYLYWSDLGKKLARGEFEKGKAAAWVFTMKNRFHWTDRQEILGPDGGPIEIAARREGLREILKDPELAEAAVKIGRMLYSKGQE